MVNAPGAFLRSQCHNSAYRGVFQHHCVYYVAAQAAFGVGDAVIVISLREFSGTRTVYSHIAFFTSTRSAFTPSPYRYVRDVQGRLPGVRPRIELHAISCHLPWPPLKQALLPQKLGAIEQSFYQLLREQGKQMLANVLCCQLCYTIRQVH